MDKDLRTQILRVCVRDRSFLKASSHDVSPGDFPEIEEEIVAECALRFYSDYSEPIGALLRSEVEEEAKKRNLGADSKKRLKELVDKIQLQKLELVSVAALQDRVRKLKIASFNAKALDKILTAHEKNQLNVETFSDIVEEAAKVISQNGYASTEYFSLEELKKRIKRRNLQATAKKLPALLIEPLDSKIKIIGRGMIGLVIAPYNTGKSLFLLHIAAAYALQGLKVLYFTLEDPKEEVEDRLDAAMSGLPIRKLSDLPNKLTNRFAKFLKNVKGRVRIVDATEGGWTVSKFEKAWETEKTDGFEADVIIVDYDDEIECEKQFKGESARRFEFAEIYRRLRRLAVKTDTILWTASQAGRQAEGKKIVTGKDIAEDISKARKVFFAVSIGSDQEDETKKYLYIVRHKMDRARFVVPIYTDFSCGIFYDRQKTLADKDL